MSRDVSNTANQYFTGKPCKHGHIAPRYKRNGSCSACQRMYSEQNREGAAQRSRHSYAKNAKKVRERVAEWARNNPDKIARYQRNWRSKVGWPDVLIKTVGYRAKSAGIAFDLTVEWARRRWTGRCEVTGEEFIIGPLTALSPSVDRIDPEIGYVQENCRFVTHGFNSSKNKVADRAVQVAMTEIEALQRLRMETVGFCA